jgi:hypothetical protein
VKKIRPLVGKRLAIGLSTLVLAGIGTMAILESFSGHDGPLSSRLRDGLNHAMIAASKFGMGLSEVYDESRKTSEEPEGMIMLARSEPADALPRGITPRGEPVGFMAKQSRELHKASRDAFISAQKVELYGK